MMKLCKDCAHFRASSVPDDGDCLHPDVVWVHPVTGAKRHPSAFNQRCHGSKCGPTAQLWQYDPGSPPEPDEMEDMG